MTNPEEKYGQKIEYDPLWKGPMQNIRFPTDRIWLIVFILYIFLYIFAAIYGFRAGDLQTLSAPTDNAGRVCGFDPEVSKKSNLLYLNLTDCLNDYGICVSPSTCLAECPQENFIFKRENNIPIDKLREKLICTSDIDVATITSLDQLEVLVKHNRCAKWYLKSESYRGRCLPTAPWEGHENETITEADLNNIKKALRDEEYFVSKLYNDSKKVLYPVLIAIFCGGIIALVFVVLLKWYAVPFFYTSITIFCAAACYGIVRLIILYVSTKRGDTLFALIIFTAVLVGIIVAVIYFRKKIYLACQLVKESSKAVMHLSSTLLFPIIPYVLYILIISLSVTVFMSLLTITVPNYEIERLDNGGEEDCQCTDYPVSLLNDSTPCDPDTFNSKCKTPSGGPCIFLQCRLESKMNPTYTYVFHSINAFGLYWLLFFVSGFEYMVLGGTFASWYWTFNKNNIGNYALIESSYRTVRYHMGSIAVGSLILTISQMIRLILRGLQQNFRSTNNTIAQGFVFCCRSIFDMIDSFLNFLNYNAYIMCAVHGKSFVQSAKTAFQLIMRNVVKIVVVNTVADWLFFMVKLLITIITGVGVAIYYGYTTEMEETGEVEAASIAIMLTVVGTFIISSVFFSVSTIAVNTLFLCFIEDSERNDGSEDRPYYMSDKLKKLLHK